MASRTVKSQDFDRELDRGLAPEQFKYRFLAEGDSWMERSSALTPSLPEHLARAMERTGEDVLIVNLALFGDTMRRIGACVSGDFSQWLNTAFNWKFDAILLSAGGNDFIDAARDPPPGLGILKNLAGQQPPLRGQDCLDSGALDKLEIEYLDPNFAALYEQVQASRHADIPIFLNQYDTPVARNAPAPPGRKAWLYEAYVRNAIPQALWPDLTDTLFAELRQTIAEWALDRPSVFVVPTFQALLPAQAGSSGDNGDWINEIHPNRKGWTKLAERWHDAIRNVL
jgi:lysophospholipase L1-like esterase